MNKRILKYHVLIAVALIISSCGGGSSSSDPVSSDPVSSDPVSSDPVSSDPVSSDPVSSLPTPTEQISIVPYREITKNLFENSDPLAFDESNYQDIIEGTSNISSVTEIGLELASALYDFHQSVTLGERDWQQVNISENGVDRILICPDGGRLLSRFNSDSNYQEHVFENCSFNGYEYTGSNVFQQDESTSVYGGQFIAIPRNYVTYSLEVKDKNESSYKFYGNFEDYSVVGDPGYDYRLSYHFFYEELDERQGLSISSTIDYYEGSAGRWMEFETAAKDEGQAFPISHGNVTAWTANSSEIGYNIGESTITGTSVIGNRIVLQLDNGDPTAFDAYLFADADTVTAYTLNWVTPEMPEGLYSYTPRRLPASFWER